MSTALSQLLTRISVCGVLAAIAGACSATLDFTECEKDEHCASFFEGNTPMYCALAEKACKARPDGCGANSQCAGLGEAFICANAPSLPECASTLFEGCEAPIYPQSGKPVAGAESEAVNDHVVFMGVMLPKTGADEALGLAMQKGVLAAVADFNANGTLQGGDKVGLVVCDTTSDVGAATSVGRHLGDTLTIPVFVGPLDDVEFGAVVDEVTFAPRVNAFTMGPMATLDMSSLDTGGLVFSAMAGAAYQGSALGARIAADFAGQPTADAILLLADDRYGLGLYGAVATEASEGPKQVPQVPGDQIISSYRGVDDASKGAKAKLDAALGVLTQPSMLIVLGRSEVAEIITYYKSTGAPLPDKIYVPQRAMAAIAALADPELAGVVVAVGPDLETPQLEKLRARLGEMSLPAEAGLAYDATMTSLLAMGAVKKDDRVVGLRVADAIKKMSDKTGVPIDFATAPSQFVAAAVEAFATSKTVDLAGITGALDFDASGEVCAPMAAFTLDASGEQWSRTAAFTPNCPAATGAWADVP